MSGDADGGETIQWIVSSRERCELRRAAGRASGRKHPLQMCKRRPRPKWGRFLLCTIWNQGPAGPISGVSTHSETRHGQCSKIRHFLHRRQGQGHTASASAPCASSATGIWGPPKDKAEALATLKRLPELGVDFIDTADAYGPEISENLIREALYPYDGLLIATKGGLHPLRSRTNGRPRAIRTI